MILFYSLNFGIRCEFDFICFVNVNFEVVKGFYLGGFCN